MVLFPKAVGRSKEEIVAITGKAARVTTLCTVSWLPESTLSGRLC